MNKTRKNIVFVCIALFLLWYVLGYRARETPKARALRLVDEVYRRSEEGAPVVWLSDEKDRETLTRICIAWRKEAGEEKRPMLEVLIRLSAEVRPSFGNATADAVLAKSQYCELTGELFVMWRFNYLYL